MEWYRIDGIDLLSINLYHLLTQPEIHKMFLKYLNMVCVYVGLWKGCIKNWREKMWLNHVNRCYSFDVKKDFFIPTFYLLQARVNHKTNMKYLYSGGQCWMGAYSLLVSQSVVVSYSVNVRLCRVCEYMWNNINEKKCWK